MNHLQTHHPGSVSDDELAGILSGSVIRVMDITECPLCDSYGPLDSAELVEHVLEHTHDFSLRSLPWPKDSILNLNKPVGTFNVSLKDIDHITQWIDETSPEEECLPQLCTFDHNPPEHAEERSLEESEIDYFAQNDYFLDRSSDGRLPYLPERSRDLYFDDLPPFSLPTSQAGSD